MSNTRQTNELLDCPPKPEKFHRDCSTSIYTLPRKQDIQHLPSIVPAFSSRSLYWAITTPVTLSLPHSTKMKTTYLTTLSASFNPFSRTSHVPRLFLQLLPVKAHSQIRISQKVLPRTSTAPSQLELGFKDGRKMSFSWAERKRGEVPGKGGNDKEAQLKDIVEEVERHARILGRKEELSG